MKVPEKPMTIKEFKGAVNEFIESRSTLMPPDHRFACKKCSSIIKKGFMVCIHTDRQGNPASDEIFLAEVPYCPECDPPETKIENRECYAKIANIIAE